MFRPNLDCTYQKMTGATLYGKKTYGPAVGARVGIVKLVTGAEKTSVRTDASASRGSAHEIEADARLLFPQVVVLTPGDLVTVSGVKLTVQSVFPRYNVMGKFDHWQVDCNIYGEA